MPPPCPERSLLSLLPPTAPYSPMCCPPAPPHPTGPTVTVPPGTAGRCHPLKVTGEAKAECPGGPHTWSPPGALRGDPPTHSWEGCEWAGGAPRFLCELWDDHGVPPEWRGREAKS